MNQSISNQIAHLKGQKNKIMKSSKILLKIASIIMLLHGLTLLISTLVSPQNLALPAEFLDFVMGATFCGILLALLLGVLLWMLSCTKNEANTKLLWIVATATVVLGIIEIIFFFPYIIGILPGILAFIALFLRSRQK